MANFFNYGARNGIATVIKYVRLLCKIYAKLAPSIVSYIDGSTMTEEQKVTVLAWLDGAMAVCVILETTTQVVYEN